MAKQYRVDTSEGMAEYIKSIDPDLIISTFPSELAELAETVE